MERLRELRIQHKISQQAIANALGVSRQAYGHYEAGSREPSQEVILRLADYFDVTTDYLLGREKKVEEIPAEAGSDGALDADIRTLVHDLSDSVKLQLLDYAKFLKAQQEESKSEEITRV